MNLGAVVPHMSGTTAHPSGTTARPERYYRLGKRGDMIDNHG